MKIQCDVCNNNEAIVFCTADEAALCESCDHRVHHANKLASKHQRFSLINPSPKQFPICDICQEKRAFLFCHQDRAILCRECDVPIHTANEHTRKHNRFLLTGVKLSATSDIYTANSTAAASLANGSSDPVPDFKSEISVKKPKPVSSSVSKPPKVVNTAAPVAAAASSAIVMAANKDGNHDPSLTSQGTNSGSTSSISEYLIEMLPGWHFEDFLDSCSANFGFCKNDDSSLPYIDADVENSRGSLTSESLGLWVPQAPTVDSTQFSSQTNGRYAFKDARESTSIKTSKRWRDDAFAVPEISPSSTAFTSSGPFY